MFKLTKLDCIRISLASPEQIRKWSHGEVTKAETINYRTLKPEQDGLFCEKIFGPTKDWECACGRYKRIKMKEPVVCDRCHVEVTRAKVRRERMGHIELAAPVSHIWYFKGIPSRMGTLLSISPKQLEEVLYFAKHIVIDEGTSGLQKHQLLTETEYQTYRREGRDFVAGIGAEAVKKMLEEIDLDQLSAELHQELANLGESKRESESQKQQRIIKRLDVVEAFRQSHNRPEWMVLTVLPVIPPELRPMVQLDGGRFATADLNDLYRRVINRNNRLKRMLEMNAPEIIVRNEKRMLQEAVDALIDNGRRGRAVTGAGGRQLKSLSDLLRGKQGRFRQNLLGKRVDYSGRSVIVVGPSLKLYQCGLPKEMALELFKPFVIEQLNKQHLATNVKSAKHLVERLDPKVWDVLENVIKDHPVMLNRAPTLHRLGIQAFEPVLVEGKALKLHPLCCTAFNADFDGDQMAVHVPLSMEAQAEARFLMLAANNILKPSDGKPVICPTQDMVLGCYYLTMVHDGEKGTDSMFTDVDEALMAYGTGRLHLEAPCYIRIKKTFTEEKFLELISTTMGETMTDPYDAIDRYDEFIKPAVDQAWEKYNELKVEYDNMPEQTEEAYNALREARTAAVSASIRMEPLRSGDIECSMVKYTTIGRVIFNNAVPQDMGWKKREKLEDMFELEVDVNVSKKQLGKIVDSCYRAHGVTDTATMLDNVKALGYSYSTRAALTVSVADILVPAEKGKILAEAESKVRDIEEMFFEGTMSENERYSKVIEIWEAKTDEVTGLVKKAVEENRFNPINMMADSGARGSINQIRQLSGMRGLMASPTGKTIELPIKSNFREGLSVLEFFLSSHGSRKSLADTAMKTADSGYMTRRLVDVSQENVIREIDCFANRHERVRGLKVRDIGVPGDIIEGLEDRITGRVTAEDVVDPTTGEVLAEANEMITYDMAKKIIAAGVTEVTIRTVLTCQCGVGVCAKCYGANMTNGKLVDIGEAVGIIAAQSIGEPGTQLTMRTFHTGGVAGGEDITQGLPRVEELFEARKPKREATLTEIPGTVHIVQEKKARKIVVQSNEDADSKAYPINFGSKVRVQEGDEVQAGDILIEGSINPHDLLRIKGVRDVQDYIVREVQSTYRRQGVDIADKHIEVIVRQMMRKVKIEEANDTDLLPGSLVDIYRFEEVNKEALMADKRPATAKRVLLGITKAALATESFMSAASFQETTRVLTEAAIKGKSDPLLGLKENVIIGKQIPAGTGLRYYSDIEVEEAT